MIGKARDIDVPPLDADDAFHFADLNLLALQRAALLDVQLEVPGEIAALARDRRQPGGIATQELDAIANRLAARVRQLEILLREFTADDPAAVFAAFFVLPDDDFDRMAQVISFAQRLRDLDRAQRTSVPS
jgi:hypothetical protein